MASNKHIVVLGAGVTGLTSALFLAEAGHKVTIVAAHVPGDSSIEYTSPWAGAHWLPHSRVNEPVICDWDVQTYDYWLDLIRREEEDHRLSRSGLKQIDSYQFWDKSPDYDIWYAPHVEAFRQLSPTREPIVGVNRRAAASASDVPSVEHGAYYKAASINVPRYLLYLQEKAQNLGVKVLKARLETSQGFLSALQDVESRVAADGKPACFVNATGLGARKLCGDEAMFPIRGQTVLVKGEARSTITRIGDGYGGVYVIPRPGSGTTILGGTKEEGVWDETPDPQVTERILEYNSWQIPELLTGPDGGFEVLSVQCGLRPGRRGGPRVEGEIVGGKRVVHSYGHAGAGYQNSVGCARRVVALVGESLGAEGVVARL